MAWILFVILIVVPIVEIAIIIQVGQLIGPLWTVALLIASAVVGSWLLRREGRRTWRAFREALAEPRVPTRQVADGALVLLGGALMITPGFLSDVVGILCLLPPTRTLLRRAVTGVVARRLLASGAASRRVRARRGPGRPYPPAGTDTSRDHRIIEGEIDA
ncbi:MAG: FxsA family protein [Actinomycetota bacterium]|nr:FxsA family protein [Actinomycetota bacterium]